MKKEVLGVIFAVEFERYRLLKFTSSYNDCESVSDGCMRDLPNLLHYTGPYIHSPKGALRARSGDGAQASLASFRLGGQPSSAW